MMYRNLEDEWWVQTFIQYILTTLEIDKTFFNYSLPCVSVSGQYVFDLMEKYNGGISVLWVAIFESAVIMWIYGVNRFADDLSFMLDHKVT